MKKKILSAILAATMLTASGAAFAETMLISENLISEGEAVMTKQYITASFTATSVRTEDNAIIIGCSDESAMEAEILISDSTPIFDNTGASLTAADITEGASLTMFMHCMEPMTMQFPPQYRPNVLIVGTEGEGFVDVDVYSDTLVNSDNSLSLSIAEETQIVMPDGSAATAEDIKGLHLAVFYTNTTRGIPAQTTPSKVVVLNKSFEGIELPELSEDEVNGPAAIGDETTILDDEMAVTPVDDINVPAAAGDETTILDDEMAVTPETKPAVTVNGTVLDIDFVTVNDTLMLPVRVIAETMGLEVKWDDELKAVSVGTVPMGVYFAIGTDEYSKARMTPAKLGQAPLLIKYDETTSLTYVPAKFFSEILDAQIETAEDGSITITRQ